MVAFYGLIFSMQCIGVDFVTVSSEDFENEVNL
jgi:hypothetical protein